MKIRWIDFGGIRIGFEWSDLWVFGVMFKPRRFGFMVGFGPASFWVCRAIVKKQVHKMEAVTNESN